MSSSRLHSWGASTTTSEALGHSLTVIIPISVSWPIRVTLFLSLRLQLRLVAPVAQPVSGGCRFLSSLQMVETEQPLSMDFYRVDT